jgi:excalibur calcium-binding domain-containing protein
MHNGNGGAMKKLILVVIVVLVAWHQYGTYREEAGLRAQASDSTSPAAPASLSRKAVPATSDSFKCDGRIYCSQMTSCEEATFFLKNCPGVKMDGNHDGGPCEQQWCR